MECGGLHLTEAAGSPANELLRDGILKVQKRAVVFYYKMKLEEDDEE
jgi:hypothetical protein